MRPTTMRQMAMKLDSKCNALAVHLHARRIGVLNRLAGDHHLFSFEQDYIDDSNRPSLSLSFKGQGGGVVSSVRPVSHRLPSFFSNLLPEGHLRTYLAEQAGVRPSREFSLLAALGADLPGAVTVTPFSADEPGVDPYGAPRDYEPGPDVLQFSLAGVQLKFSAIMEASGGLTIPAHGVGGFWIVKLPSTQFPAVAENEYVMLELARAIGISVPPIRLVPVSAVHGLPAEAARLQGEALVVQRFDRTPDGKRIHMEDFAQVFGLFPDDKYGHRSYANIAAVLRAETGEEGAHEFVRRLAFSVSIGNGDMHLKNWSLLYPDGRSPALSPAYDFVATLPYIAGDQLALTFGGSRSLGGITVDQVRHFADKASLPVSAVWQTVRETVEQTADAWDSLSQKELLPPDMRKVIHKQIQTVAAITCGRREKP
jgi:serine/threonine-protein kinase HipA